MTLTTDSFICRKHLEEKDFFTITMTKIILANGNWNRKSLNTDM